MEFEKISIKDYNENQGIAIVHIQGTDIDGCIDFFSTYTNGIFDEEEGLIVIRLSDLYDGESIQSIIDFYNKPLFVELVNYKVIDNKTFIKVAGDYEDDFIKELSLNFNGSFGSDSCILDVIIDKEDIEDLIDNFNY